MIGESRVLAHAAEIAYVRFRVPDLERQRIFLEDFGMNVLPDPEGTGRLFGRGEGGRSFFYIAEKGPSRFLGAGFQMAERSDLDELSGLEGASPVEPIDGPGGGYRVRMTDPNGFEIDAVFGQNMQPIEPVSPRPPLNFTERKGRLGEPVRLGRGPARVRRVGHFVLDVRNFRESEDWYKRRFGFLTSDEIYAGEESNTLGAFMRCDLGDLPVDHHTVFLIGGREPGINHVAFEVDDWDTVMLGHDHLKAGGYEAHWGVGKHILGSQVFDYWKDPYGNVVEHYTDGDLFDASVPSKREPVEVLLGVQWGPGMPGHGE